MAAKKAEATEVNIVALKRAYADILILGIRPLIFHNFSEKAKRELLFPRPGRKTAAEKAQSIKHDPILEYRDSMYPVDDGETALGFPATGFKGAAGTAALETEGVKKTQINRCLYVTGDALNGVMISIYGIPQMYMAMVRMSDMARTPDVRTRCIIPKWAAHIRVNYVQPTFNSTTIASLFVNAGIMCGVGDDRIAKGHGGYGAWEIVDETNLQYQNIVATGGREAQKAAIDNPEFYDDKTRKLYEWVVEEFKIRGPKAV